MQSGKWSHRLVGIFGAVLLVALSIALIVALNNSRNDYSGAEPSDLVKIHVYETGLYQVSSEDLVAFNQANNRFSSENLHLSEGGTLVPYFLEGESLYFYGVAPKSRYAPYRPYILSMNEPGLLMDESILPGQLNVPIRAISSTVHLEENNIYDSRSMPVEEPYPGFLDPWYWTVIQNDDETIIEFSLADVVKDSTATLRTAFFGATSIASVDPDHNVDLYLNGVYVDTVAWDGEAHKMTESLIEPGTLQPGTNTLVFDNRYKNNAAVGDNSANGDESSLPPLDIMRLDWFAIDYSSLPRVNNDQVVLSGADGEARIDDFSNRPKVIDITNPRTPSLVGDWDFDDGVLSVPVAQNLKLFAAGPQGIITQPKITPVGRPYLRDMSMQADLIILSSSELSPTLKPLVEFREEQGLHVIQVSIDDVYNEFGYGEESPDGIAAFLSYALSEWADPAPSYLLLVGEASYDYKNYLGQSGNNFIPAPMVRVEYGGETVSDAVLGDTDLDGVPDIAIGRWPISAKEEAAQLVERTIAYEQGTVSDNIILAADGTSGEFATLSDDILEGSGLLDEDIQRMYGVPSEQLTEAWNEGAWLVSYVGHGSIDRWGKDDVFSASAVPDLNSESPPPIVLQLTCLTGFFAHPTVDSISELMLRHENGPVEIIAATSLTLSSSQRPFGINLLKGFQDPDVLRIGDALQRAKAALDVENSRSLREISETFSLLGDPSALIVRP